MSFTKGSTVYIHSLRFCTQTLLPGSTCMCVKLYDVCTYTGCVCSERYTVTSAVFCCQHFNYGVIVVVAS